MGLQSIVRFFLPRDEHWFDMIEELGRLGNEAAHALLRFRDEPGTSVQEALQTIEHKADDTVRRMEDSLARTFVTPLDREDLHNLTGQLDDIIDLMNLSARAFNLYHLERPTEPMGIIMDHLEHCTRLIAEAVPHLRSHNYSKLIEDVRKIRAVEKETDTVYRKAISELFAAPTIDARLLLKQKEILDDLEAAVDHCDDVADLLANLAMKHG